MILQTYIIDLTIYDIGLQKIGVKKSEFVAKTQFLWDPLDLLKCISISISTCLMISNQVDLKVIMCISTELHESLTHSSKFEISKVYTIRFQRYMD